MLHTISDMAVGHGAVGALGEHVRASHLASKTAMPSVIAPRPPLVHRSLFWKAEPTNYSNISPTDVFMRAGGGSLR